MYDLIIRDATIVRSGGRLVADVAIEDGKIAFVGGNPAGKAREELSAIGRFLIPGVIDGDVTLTAPGTDASALWKSEGRAAIAKGVTTLLHRPVDGTSPQDVRDALAAADGALVGGGVWAVARDDRAEGLDELVAEGVAVGISATVTEGGLDLDGLARLHAETSGLLGVRVEDPATVAKATRKWQNVPAPLHNDVHSAKAALAASKRLLELVRGSSRPVHIHQLSTAGELNLYDPFRDDVPLTSGITPVHLFLSTDITDQEGALLKHDPAIRPELDRRALWAAIKRGRVDLFSSGHVPLSREHKSAGYWGAPSGLPGVDSLLPLLLGAIKHGRLGLERLVEMCCEAPARIFGLQGKGAIEEGADADLVLFSEGETAKLRDVDLHSSAGWSPYIGREIGVPPQLVVVNGRIVARDGVLAGDLQPAAPVRYLR
ncbi:MAG: dihydroorotase family protein [Alphaproteobacteria bacterium]|nr:dihydroorotase family protein [Alphaproteobacteria bacterium]